VYPNSRNRFRSAAMLRAAVAMEMYGEANARGRGPPPECPAVSSRKNAPGVAAESARSYDLTRDGFTLLVMGWTGERTKAEKDKGAVDNGCALDNRPSTGRGNGRPGASTTRPAPGGSCQRAGRKQKESLGAWLNGP
jgi:hypothetical protein